MIDVSAHLFTIFSVALHCRASDGKIFKLMAIDRQYSQGRIFGGAARISQFGYVMSTSRVQNDSYKDGLAPCREQEGSVENDVL
jgi:hypothetical protein